MGEEGTEISISKKNMGKSASKEAKKAFDEYDLDGNGYLERGDLKRKMMSDVDKEMAKKKAEMEKQLAMKKKEMEKVVDQRVAAIVGKVDTDGDGKINFEEFKKVVLNENTQDFFEQQLDLTSAFKK